MESSPGEFDPCLQAMSSSKVAFEWCLGSGASEEHEIVVAWCKHAVRRSGVPAPVSVGKVQSCAPGPDKADFEGLAAAAVASDQQDALKSHFGENVKEFECRYLGVLDGTGKADAHAPALPESQLAFEWGLQTKDGNETHPVTMKCKQAWDRQRINLPKRPRPLGELEGAARTAMDKRDLLASKLKVKDLAVSCDYLGVRVGDSEPDIDKPAFSEDLLVFKWVLRTENWEWVDSVSMRCRHVPQGVPLPRCTVTKQRLVDVADASARKHSADHCFDVVCRYEGALESSSAGDTAKLKERILVKDLAKFHWEVCWARGHQVATTHVRAASALEDKRWVPLPDGWATALQALRAHSDARVISNADLVVGITAPKCLLVGLPKQVVPADVGAAVGARVLLSEKGRPLQFALLANIRGNLWYCHSGRDIFSEATP